jgi:hypothetical protein
VTPPELPEPSSFLSGESGEVSGLRLTARAAVEDLSLALAGVLTLAGPRLDRAATRLPRRSVLVVSVYRPRSLLARAVAQLVSERHDVRFALGATAAEPDPALAGETALTSLAGGKFENLNRLLETAGADADWLLAVDDDILLPHRFLDRFLAVCERLSLDLAQPAQSRRSHAAWRVTRRRAGLARLTRFVEIGPLTAFSRRAAAELLPFPELRFGWGLDSHWGALARERGWRLGVVDALPVRHESGPVAASYGHAQAIEEARGFLAGRPFLDRAECQSSLRTVRRLPS